MSRRRKVVSGADGVQQGFLVLRVLLEELVHYGKHLGPYNEVPRHLQDRVNLGSGYLLEP